MDKAELDNLEAMGEAAVLQAFAAGRLGRVGSAQRDEAEAWLRSKAMARNFASSASADAMAAEQLALARSAAAIAAEHLRVARQQKNVEIAAMVLSAITAIIAAVIGALLAGK